MMSSWWLLWAGFMLFFFIAPVGYGWGYRGWGAPYPRYIQRRRGAEAVAIGGSPGFDHEAWGLGGDFLWLVLVVAVVWAFSVYWWR